MVSRQNWSPVPASRIASFLGGKLVGPDVSVAGVSSLLQPEPRTLMFARALDGDAIMRLSSVESSVVLVQEATAELSCAQIVTAAPRLDFARAAAHFFPPARPNKGVHPTAVVDETAELGADVSIGPYAVIGPNVTIGARTVIGAHVVLDEGTCIGEDCLIRANTVIGGPGFGFERDEQQQPVRIPHYGNVVIGDRVEIGSANTIARGTLGSTVIRDDAKLDDHVFIAHNVDVGEGAFVIAGAEVSGSVTLGARSWVAPQATIKNKIRVGEDAVIGIGAVVIRDVEAGTVVAGNPARELTKKSGS